MPTKRELEERVQELESHLEEFTGRARSVLGYDDSGDDEPYEEDDAEGDDL